MTIREVVAKYNAGLITQKEAEKFVAQINLGSDTKFYTLKYFGNKAYLN